MIAIAPDQLIASDIIADRLIHPGISLSISPGKGERDITLSHLYFRCVACNLRRPTLAVALDGEPPADFRAEMTRRLPQPERVSKAESVSLGDSSNAAQQVFRLKSNCRCYFHELQHFELAFAGLEFPYERIRSL